MLWYLSGGYGATVLKFMRRAKNFTNGQYESLELPLILGRDFSGIIASKGCRVGDRLKLGDKVWGVVPIEQQGCHANYVILDSALVNMKSFCLLNY